MDTRQVASQQSTDGKFLFSLASSDFHLINQLIQAQIEVDNEVDTNEKRLLGKMMLAKLNDG